jgi:hypothetical protein
MVTLHYTTITCSGTSQGSYLAGTYIPCGRAQTMWSCAPEKKKSGTIARWLPRKQTTPTTPIPSVHYHHQHMHTTCPKTTTNEQMQSRRPKWRPASFGPSGMIFCLILFHLLIILFVVSLLQTMSPSHDAMHLGPRRTPPIPYITAASLCSQGGNRSHFWTTMTTQQCGTNTPLRHSTTTPPHHGTTMPLHCHVTAPPARLRATARRGRWRCWWPWGTTNKNTNREDDREKTTTTAKTGGWWQGGDNECQHRDNNAGMTDNNVRMTNDNAGTTNDGADHNKYPGQCTMPRSRYKCKSVGSFFFFFSFFHCDGCTLQVLFALFFLSFY